jgi:hypothetical protein
MAARSEPGIVRFLRYFDLVLLAVALPVFIAAQLPLLGYAAAAVGWLVQRAIRGALTKRAENAKDLRSVAGLMTGSMIGRAWLMALLVFGAGMVEREAGLTGAILVIVLFTAFFSTQFALRPYDTSPLP